MSKFEIKHLTARPGRRGGKRYFWTPSPGLRKAGWKETRLAEDAPQSIMRGQAIVEAIAWNEKVAAWRRGEIPANTPALIRPGSVEALIHDYKQSRFYLDLKPKTKRGYDQNLDIISEWAGSEPVRSLTKKQINRFYEQMCPATPAKAKAVIVMLSILIKSSQAVYSPTDIGYMEHNPAAELRLKGTAAKGRLWSPEAVQAFVEAADAKNRWSMGTAVMLNEWIGQREGDLIGLKRSVYKNGEIRFHQSKRGAGVAIPVGMVPKLQDRLNEEFARQKKSRVTATTIIVSETTGKPYKEDNFRHVFVEIRTKAIEAAEKAGNQALATEFKDLWFMHLRHTAITRLAEAEVDTKFIAAVTGHAEATCSTIIDRYLIRTAAMARTAFQKRLDKEGGE